jgi:hypothetical protein
MGGASMKPGNSRLTGRVVVIDRGMVPATAHTLRFYIQIGFFKTPGRNQRPVFVQSLFQSLKTVW